MELANLIQQVINTIGVLDIKPTYSNVDHITGIYKALVYVRDILMENEEPTEEPSPEAQEPEIMSEETVGGTAE